MCESDGACMSGRLDGGRIPDETMLIASTRCKPGTSKIKAWHYP